MPNLRWVSLLISPLMYELNTNNREAIKAVPLEESRRFIDLYPLGKDVDELFRLAFSDMASANKASGLIRGLKLLASNEHHEGFHWEHKYYDRFRYCLTKFMNLIYENDHKGEIACNVLVNALSLPEDIEDFLYGVTFLKAVEEDDISPAPPANKPLICMQVLNSIPKEGIYLHLFATTLAHIERSDPGFLEEYNRFFSDDLKDTCFRMEKDYRQK